MPLAHFTFRVSHGSQEEFAVRLYRRDNQVREILVSTMIRFAGSILAPHRAASARLSRMSRNCLPMGYRR